MVFWHNSYTRSAQRDHKFNHKSCYTHGDVSGSGHNNGYKKDPGEIQRRLETDRGLLGGQVFCLGSRSNCSRFGGADTFDINIAYSSYTSFDIIFHIISPGREFLILGIDDTLWADRPGGIDNTSVDSIRTFARFHEISSPHFHAEVVP